MSHSIIPCISFLDYKMQRFLSWSGISLISSLDQPMRHWKSNPRQTSGWGHKPPHSGPGPSECPTFNGAHTDQSSWVLEERRIWMGTEDTEGFADWEGSQSRSMQPESGGMLACLLGSEGMERLECEGSVCSVRRGFVGSRWRRTLNARCLQSTWKAQRAISRLLPHPCATTYGFRSWTWYVSWLRCSDPVIENRTLGVRSINDLVVPGK